MVESTKLQISRKYKHINTKKSNNSNNSDNNNNITKYIIV